MTTLPLLLLLLFACNNPSQSESAEQNEEEGIIKQEVEPVEGGTVYEILPQEIINHLLDSVDNIDLIFYNIDASMNADSRESAIPFLANISTTSPVNPDACKPNGRVIFLGNGEIITEADFFFSPNCAFFIFVENGNYKYANMMTSNGVDYFKSIFNSAGLKPSGSN